MSLLTSPVPEDRQDACIKAMSSDLYYILNTNSIPKEIIAKISDIGFRTINQFSHWHDTTGEVRTRLQTDFTLDPASLEARVMQSTILAAWESKKETCAAATAAGGGAEGLSGS